jgi:hypothetical protein
MMIFRRFCEGLARGESAVFYRVKGKRTDESAPNANIGHRCRQLITVSVASQQALSRLRVD